LYSYPNYAVTLYICYFGSFPHSLLSLFLLMLLQAPRSTLFPYTTLFRSFISGTTCSEIFPRMTSGTARITTSAAAAASSRSPMRSEEHTSELQSRFDLVCRLLLEKKKNASYRHLHV